MGSKKAPSGYQPTGQAQADQNYQNLTGYMSTQGQKLADSTLPALQNVTNNVTNNPYYGYAQSGANAVGALATGSVAPAQFWAAGQDASMGQDAQANAQQVYQSLSSLLPMMLQGYGSGTNMTGAAQPYAAMFNNAIPAATGGYGYADPVLQQMTGNAGTSWNESQNWMQQLLGGDLGYANTLLQNGFDPYGAQYNRGLHQTLEQANATAAQQGISGSPFAAGVSNDAVRNYNTDWQANQLQRQALALQGYDASMANNANVFGNLLNAGSGSYGSLMGGGVNAYNSLVNGATGNLSTLGSGAYDMLTKAIQGDFTNKNTSMNDAASRYLSMLTGGTGAYGNLTSLAQGSYGNASDMAAAGLNTLLTGSQAPSAAYTANQQQILDAILAQIEGSGAALNPVQTAIGDYGNYMKLGQSATQLAQQATQMNNASAASMWSGIGQLAGLALAPFTGGTSLMATSTKNVVRPSISIAANAPSIGQLSPLQGLTM